MNTRSGSTRTGELDVAREYEMVALLLKRTVLNESIPKSHNEGMANRRRRAEVRNS